MRNIVTIADRELAAYFATPVATVFIVIFLALQGTLTFNLGNFFERDQADLSAFFTFIPWVFLLLIPAMVLTFPFVLTVNYLGNPDNGVIASGYVGSMLVAGAFLSVGSAMSAATRNQVIAFVLAVAICFVFTVASYTVVTEFLSKNTPVLAEVARRMAVLDRFQNFTRGVVSARDIVYFATFIGFWLFVNTVLVDQRKAD